MQSSRKFKNGDKVRRVDRYGLKFVVVHNSYKLGIGVFNHCRSENGDGFLFSDDELELDKDAIIYGIIQEL